MTIKDYRSVRPDQLKPGDVLVCVVTLHVRYFDDRFAVYQCTYPDPQVSSDGIPQGSKLLPEQADAVAAALFPVAGWAGLKGE
jgi:hypothetical protein